MMYAQNYDERLPSCYRLPAPPYIFDSSAALQPYLRNWDVLYCPERHTVLSDCLNPTDGNRPNARCMGYGYNWGSGSGWSGAYSKQDGLVRPAPGSTRAVIGVTLSEVAEPPRCFFFGDTNDSVFLTLLRDVMPGVRKSGSSDATTNELNQPYEPPRHGDGNNFAFVDGHVQWLPFPGGQWIDGGAWVVPDMSMYSRTGHWEANEVP